MNHDPRTATISRREMLTRCSTGFGALALAGLMRPAIALPHYQPRAKHVIFCYMSGGVSHVDSFDPKPRLREEHGKPMPVKVERTQFNQNGNIFGSPFEFKRYGQSGIEVSSLFPHIGACADELAVVRSMTSGNMRCRSTYHANNKAGTRGSRFIAIRSRTANSESWASSAYVAARIVCTIRTEAS